MIRYFFLAFALTCSCLAKGQNDIPWSVRILQDYRMIADATYLVADGYEAKLDIIAPRDTSLPLPTLMYIHGGGWVGGDKDNSYLRFLPYLEMGFAVVNVEYRFASTALAPAAVEDCRCALRWLINHAEEYGFDKNRIVVSGHSAGGHLSLTTGMLSSSVGLDRRCPAVDPNGTGRRAAHEPEMPVAGIVNWYGITDVLDLVKGPNAKFYAIQWIGGLPDWKAVARRVSPVEHVQDGLPPILTIHGDADLIVPYEHAVRLHGLLSKVNVQNKLHTIPGGGHGDFNLKENKEAFQVIREFLKKHSILN